VVCSSIFPETACLLLRRPVPQRPLRRRGGPTARAPPCRSTASSRSAPPPSMPPPATSRSTSPRSRPPSPPWSAISALALRPRHADRLQLSFSPPWPVLRAAHLDDDGILDLVGKRNGDVTLRLSGARWRPRCGGPRSERRPVHAADPFAGLRER